MEHKENHSDVIRYMYIIRFKQRVHRHILRLIILNLFNIHSTIREVPLHHALVRRHNGKWDTTGIRKERDVHTSGPSNVPIFARLFLLNRM